MKYLRYIRIIIDGLNRAVGQMASWGGFILVLMVTLDVILRYCFKKSYIINQEIEWTIYSAMFLLGAGYTLKKDSHVRVDVIYHRLKKKTRAVINCIGTIFFLLPGAFLVIKTTIPFVKTSWAIRESSPEPGGLPFFFAIKALIPLGFTLLALQALVFFLENLETALGKNQKKSGIKE